MKKVILITGVSSGIGKQTAKLLAKHGHIVYGTARRLDNLNDLETIGVRLLKVDVTDDASMLNGIEQLIGEENHIDVLINNAGYGLFGSLEDVSMLDAKNQFDVNVFGLARLTQLVLPYMRRQKHGKIINVSSMAGCFGEPLGAWYHATKYAVEGLSDSLRMEVKQFGIQVVVIQPGAIKTKWDKIAGESLIKSSGNTAYCKMATQQAEMLQRVFKNGSHPSVVANAISKAVNHKNPKTRYVVGAGAKLVLFARSVLSDKMFDSIMLRQLK